jgi:hypothetical protein
MTSAVRQGEGVMSCAQTDEVSATAPLRLADAMAIAFPCGGMTVSGLRREIRRGRLAYEVIAGKQFVTLLDIKQMRDQCRVEQRVPASISASGGDARPCGLSSTEKTRSALAAAQVIAEGLKKPSPATSQRSTGQIGRIVTLRRFP